MSNSILASKSMTQALGRHQRLRTNAGCLLRQHDDPVNPLIKDSEWGVLEECSRAQLMWALQQRLPPSVMIPDSRLEALVEQALESQVLWTLHMLRIASILQTFDLPGKEYLVPQREGPCLHVSESFCASQVARCPYHNTQHFRISLFSNYQAGIEQLPTQPHQVTHHPP